MKCAPEPKTKEESPLAVAIAGAGVAGAPRADIRYGLLAPGQGETDSLFVWSRVGEKIGHTANPPLPHHR